jgi:hypothetical protein
MAMGDTFGTCARSQRSVIAIIACRTFVKQDLQHRGGLMKREKRDLLDLLKFELKFFGRWRVRALSTYAVAGYENIPGLP